MAAHAPAAGEKRHEKRNNLVYPARPLRNVMGQRSLFAQLNCVQMME